MSHYSSFYDSHALEKPFIFKHFEKDQLISALRTMYLIRLFEEAAEESYMRGMVHGTMHLSIGQEASATGICFPLTIQDQITSTHRGHGHSIAKGADISAMFAEFFGKVTGSCKGRGGSMHIADFSTGNLGANGIVGGGIPIATGAALSVKMLNKKHVVVCFFGDGANNEGVFHECLNMASLWKLPVIYVCENNGYGMSTSVKNATSVLNIADRARSYGITGLTVDGNNFSDVVEASFNARERALSGQGPTLIETITYRYRGHSKSDRNRYRSKEEIEEWITHRDPIKHYENELLRYTDLEQTVLDEIHQETQGKIAKALVFARESSFPHPSQLEKFVYTETD